MLSGALTAGLLVVLGQLPWEVALRSDGRVSRDAEELQLTPQVTLGYEWRDVLVHLTYNPQLVLQGAGPGERLEHAQAGSMAASLRLDRDTNASAAQTFSVGSFNVSWLASSLDTPPPSTVRSAESPGVDMFNESTSVSLDHALSRQIQLAGTARYAIEGGRADGLATFPRNNTAELGASGSWVERADSLSLSLAGSRGWVSTSQSTWMAGASSSWRHALSAASERALRGAQALRIGEREEPRYETEVSGGVAITGGSAREEGRVLPTVSLTLRRDAPTLRAGAFGARVSLHYAPTLDLATGGLTPRYELSASCDLRLHRQLVAFAGSGAGIAGDPIPPVPDVLAQGGVGLIYEPVAGVSISASARVAKLSQVEWGGVVTTTITRAGRF